MSHMSIAYCNQIVEYLRELHFSSGTLSNAKGTLSIEIPERRRLRHREYQNDARSSANHSVFDLPSLSGLRGLKKEKTGTAACSWSAIGRHSLRVGDFLIHPSYSPQMPGACSLAEDCPSVYEGFRSGVRDDLTFPTVTPRGPYRFIRACPWALSVFPVHLQISTGSEYFQGWGT